MYHNLKLTINMQKNIFQNLLLHCPNITSTMTKHRTSDLSITRGCKSVLCHPAVNGASMLCPLNLNTSPTLEVTYSYLAHILFKFYAPVFFCCLKRRFRAVISGWCFCKTGCPMQASCSSCIFYQPSYLQEEMESKEEKV